MRVVAPAAIVLFEQGIDEFRGGDPPFPEACRAQVIPKETFQWPAEPNRQRYAEASLGPRQQFRGQAIAKRVNQNPFALSAAKFPGVRDRAANSASS